MERDLFFILIGMNIGLAVAFAVLGDFRENMKLFMEWLNGGNNEGNDGRGGKIS